MILLGSEEPRQGGDVAATCCSLCKINVNIDLRQKYMIALGVLVFASLSLEVL